MKRIIRYSSFLPVVMLLLSSCFDDKGNYDYKDIKEPVVTIAEVEAAENNTLVYDRFNTLTLTPTVKIDGKDANPADTDYEWRLLPENPIYYEGQGWEQIRVIGNSKDLSYKLDDVPRTYIFSLKATNKLTQAATSYTFNLEISKTTGWVVVDEASSGTADLSIIRDQQLVPGLQDDKVGIMWNLYSQSNDGAKLEDVKFANYRRVGNGAYNHIYVYSHDGMYKVDPVEFTLVTDDYTTMFSIPPAAFVPMADYYESPLPSKPQVFIANNNAYVIRWNMMMQKDVYTTAVSSYGVPCRFEPFIAGIPDATGRTAVAVLLYEKSYSPNGTFIAINRSNGNIGVLSLPYADNEFNPMDINNNNHPDKNDPEAGVKVHDMNAVHLGTGREGITCAIFKDALDNNKPYLFIGDFRVFATPAALLKKDISGLTGIANATQFLFSPRGDVMFYATPDGVYRYSYYDANAAAAQVLGTPGTEQVTSMKIYSNSNNESYNGRVLMVATYDGSAGKVYKIPFNELSGVPGTPETFTGFGKIVDMFNLQ